MHRQQMLLHVTLLTELHIAHLALERLLLQMDRLDVFLQKTLCRTLITALLTVKRPFLYMHCADVDVQMNLLSEPPPAHVTGKVALLFVNQFHMFLVKTFGCGFVFAQFAFELFVDRVNRFGVRVQMDFLTEGLSALVAVVRARLGGLGGLCGGLLLRDADAADVRSGVAGDAAGEVAEFVVGHALSHVDGSLVQFDVADPHGAVFARVAAEFLVDEGGGRRHGRRAAVRDAHGGGD